MRTRAPLVLLLVLAASSGPLLAAASAFAHEDPEGDQRTRFRYPGDDPVGDAFPTLCQDPSTDVLSKEVERVGDEMVFRVELAAASADATFTCDGHVFERLGAGARFYVWATRDDQPEFHMGIDQDEGPACLGIAFTVDAGSTRCIGVGVWEGSTITWRLPVAAESSGRGGWPNSYVMEGEFAWEVYTHSVGFPVGYWGVHVRVEDWTSQVDVVVE